jgi:hypothetical protein
LLPRSGTAGVQRPRRVPARDSRWVPVERCRHRRLHRTTAPKVAALTERPNVALTIDTPGPPARALLVRGVASIEIVDGVASEYLAAAAKSTKGEELAAFEANVRALYKQMARITIAPTWARYYDFGAGRLPTFLQRLLDSGSAGGG